MTFRYYAIVWVYNRRLIETNGAKGSALSFMFRPRLRLIAFYLSLILLYGSSDLGASFLPVDTFGHHSS